MKIAQVMAGAPDGGAELFYERMSQALAAAGQDVLPLIRRDAARAARLTAAGLPPAQFAFGGRFDLLTKAKLRHALHAFGAEVAVAWMSRAASHLPSGPWVNVGRLGGYYGLKYFRSCRHLVGNTHGIVTYLRGHGVAADHAHYLPNFVEDFATTSGASRAELGVPNGVPLVLGLGRLHPVKGFDLLIRAMASLPEAFCVIAGEGPERPRLESLILELSLAHRVFLSGWRRDAGALLKAADLFISSSRHEPLGNMILEAWSARRPVLAARAAGPTELIAHGSDGILVPIDDPAALAAAAHSLLADRTGSAALAEAGRQRFEAEFSESVVTAAWLDLLHRIAR